MDAKAALAKDHAAVLVTTHGHDVAERIALEKLADAPFFVNGDARFWRLTLANIKAQREASE